MSVDSKTASRQSSESTPGGGASSITTPSEDAGSLAELLEAAARTSEIRQPPQPDLLGSGFSIRRKLGAGAFGVVYEAHDHQREQTVALKVLHHLDPSALYRFKREFRALTRMRHPQLVQLYELHEYQGHWFFSMELVAGRSLSALFAEARRAVGQSQAGFQAARTRSLPSAAFTDDAFQCGDFPATGGTVAAPKPSLLPAYLAQIRPVFTELGRAVQALHQEGMLHRDLKPSNVQVADDGGVKLLDFGMVLERRGGTSEGAVVGTPLYMAPEQAMGAEELTPACDWYAVGVMLYEALVGRPPFAGTTRQLALLHAKQTRDPPAPSRLVDGVPPALDRLCLALLRRDPGERPPVRIILQALSGKPPSGGQATPGDGPTWPRALRPDLFVGRQPQLAALRRALRDLDSGAVVCLVSGVSGVGKSALLEHFIASLDSEDVLVLSGASYPQESVPYKAWDMAVDLLSQYLSRLPLAAQTRLTPEHAGALRRVFPVLGRVKAIAQAADPAEGLDAREVRRRAFGAFRALMARLSQEHQLIVHLDDLQWSDIDSIELLLQLFGGDDAPRMLVLGSFRSDERESSPALQVLLERLPLFRPRLLPLDPLSPDDATTLASQLSERALSRERLEAIVRESGGNPIFVAELSHAAAAFDGSAAEVNFDRVVLRRVSALSPDTRRLLNSFAVAAEPIRPKQAATAVGLRISHDNVRELLSEHLLRIRNTTAGQQAEIYHARIRDSLLRGLSQPATVALHAGLAQTLEQDEAIDPERLAGHFFAAGQPAPGWRLIRRAADEAVETLAFARAIRLFRKLVDQSSPDDEEKRRLQCSLASALANAGRYDEAVRHFDAGLTGEQRAPQGKLQVGLTVLRQLPPLFFRLFFRGGQRQPTAAQSALLGLRYEKTVALIYVDPLRMFLESLALQKDLSRYPVRSTARGFEIWSLVSGMLAFSGLSFSLSRRILERCTAVLEPTEHDEVLSCRLSELVLAFSVGQWAAIPAFDGELLRRNLEDGRFWHVCTYILYGALLHLGRGEFGAAERLIEQLQEIAKQHDYGHVANAYAFFLRATLLVRARRLGDAEATIGAGLAYHREIGMEGPQILFHSALVLARLFGDGRAGLDGAREAMAAADALVARQAPAPPHYVALYCIARVRLAQRQLEHAMARGDRRAARRWRRAARADLAAATRNARRYAFGRVETLMLRGRQCWLLGRRRRALRWWQAAIAEAQRLASPLDEGRARFQLGSSLLEAGEVGPEIDPAAQLERAQRIFEDLGASWDLARLRTWRAHHG